MEERNLIGPKGMADILGVPVSWIYQRTCLGREAIPYLKIGKYVRFNPQEVVDFFKVQDN